MALTREQYDQLETLADRVLQTYSFAAPPVPVERILSNPPLGLTAVDINDLSLVFGAGTHLYDYRLALGRLLYREILRNEDAGKGLPQTSEAAATFAMALLLPAAWIAASTEGVRVDVDALGESYQVSAETVSVRLKQLRGSLSSK